MQYSCRCTQMPESSSTKYRVEIRRTELQGVDRYYSHIVSSLYGKRCKCNKLMLVYYQFSYIFQLDSGHI